MQSKLGPLTKRALRARRMVMLNYREPGVYEASLSEPTGWAVSAGRSAEAALDALEARLREDPAAREE